MKKICPYCGTKMVSNVYVFQPSPSQGLLKEIKSKFPTWHFTMDSIEGQKIKITSTESLTKNQKKKLDQLFEAKSYLEDIEEEKKEAFG